jgi:hypothetical protein
MKVSSIGKIYSPNTKKTNFNNYKKNTSPAFGVDIRYSAGSLKSIKDKNIRDMVEESFKKMEKRYKKVGSDNINIILMANEIIKPDPSSLIRRKTAFYRIYAIVQYKDVPRAREEILEANKTRPRHIKYDNFDEKNIKLIEESNPRAMRELGKPQDGFFHYPDGIETLPAVLDDIYKIRLKHLINLFTYTPFIPPEHPPDLKNLAYIDSL